MAAAGSLAMKRHLRLQLASVTSESMTSNPLLVEDEEGKRIKTVTSKVVPRLHAAGIRDPKMGSFG